MLLENTSLNLCLHWLGFKVNHSLLIEPFLGFITLFKPVSDCIPFKLGRRKPCFLEHYMVYLTQRLRQYTPKKEAREDRLVVKLLYWDFGNLGASSPSVWRWESLEVGKRQLPRAAKPQVKLRRLLWLRQSTGKLPWQPLLPGLSRVGKTAAGCHWPLVFSAAAGAASAAQPQLSFLFLPEPFPVAGTPRHDRSVRAELQRFEPKMDRPSSLVSSVG